MATGTIFDRPWFALERPAFERIANLSDPVLTFALIIAALGIIWLAMTDKTLLKAVMLGWILLP